MKNIFIVSLLALIGLSSCSKEEKKGETSSQNQSFNIQEYFVAGTLNVSNSKNVIVIRFLENNKAILSQNYVDLVAKYSFSDKKHLIVEVKDDANYRILKFDLNDKNEIVYGYYQALSQVSPIAVSLLKIADKNQFASSVFTGRETAFIGTIREERLFYNYKFDEKGEKYGKGGVLKDIMADKSFELINNSAFKYYDQSSFSSAIGYVDSEGNFYISGKEKGNTSFFGTFKKQ